MKKFLASTLGSSIVGIVLFLFVFFMLGELFNLGGAIGGAIAGAIGFGTSGALQAIFKSDDDAGKTDE